MNHRHTTLASAVLLLAAGLCGSGASAAPPGEAPSAEVAQREQARALFEEGMAHFKKDEYREAYDALQKSLALKETRGAMAAAASCLKQLGRYDEALSLYEEALRAFPDPDPRSSFRVKVDAAIAELRGLVGTLVVAGDAPEGAALFVDDRRLGVLPLGAPLRLSVGMHRVRVEKEGFEPIAATVEVRAQQESVAELVALSRTGRLAVSEAHNWPLHVEVDGKDVGVTPWEGPVAVGEHRVRLHGFVDPDALEACAAPEAAAAAGREVHAATEGAVMASPERAATLRLYETERVMLAAEEQDASLRVDSTPVGARLWIDGKELGRTPWAGRLPLGAHAVEVRAGGFIAARQSVRLERRKQRELSMVLERERPPAEAPGVGRVVGAGVAYGVGALGLGVFGVAGALALDKSAEIKEACPADLCPGSKATLLDQARALGAVSTVGLVVGGLGAATGTVILVVMRPRAEERRGAIGAGWRAGVGPGRIDIQGRF